MQRWITRAISLVCILSFACCVACTSGWMQGFEQMYRYPPSFAHPSFHDGFEFVWSEGALYIRKGKSFGQFMLGDPFPNSMQVEGVIGFEWNGGWEPWLRIPAWFLILATAVPPTL